MRPTIRPCGVDAVSCNSPVSEQPHEERQMEQESEEKYEICDCTSRS